MTEQQTLGIEAARLLAESLHGQKVTACFLKADGRERREHGELEYQPEQERIRIAKQGGYRLISFESITSLTQNT